MLLYVPAIEMNKKISTYECSVLYQNRCCYQKDFDIIISARHYDEEGGCVKSIYRFRYPPLTKTKKLNSILTSNSHNKTLTFATDVWTICNRGFPTSKSSLSAYDLTNSLIQLPDCRKFYCACFFMKSLYVFGGYDAYGYIHVVQKKDNTLRTCIKYDTQSNKWSSITSMQNKRSYSACAVFEGKIVLAGGACLGPLRLVEKYDHHENKWTSFPDLNYPRFNHGACSVGNKMFVIGGCNKMSSEVFDSVSRKFTVLKKPLNAKGPYDASIVRIGYKLLVISRPFNSPKTKVYKFNVYDVDKDEWSLEDIDDVELKHIVCWSKVSVV